MSGHEQRETIDQAIRDCIGRDNPGTIVTGYVVVVQGVDTTRDDTTAFVYDAAEGQAVTTSLGLLDVGLNFWRRQIGAADD